MSDGMASAAPRDSAAESDGGSGKAEATKQEAIAVKDTATDAAKDVAGVAKEEAGSVAHEAKIQLQDLYSQTREELSDQAGKQQHRLASGLRSVGDELGSMARSSEGTGVASDLVHSASERIGSAATWLSDRDPAGVLDEVKAFARRRPGVFIAGAVITGVLVGRLTRALASSSDSAGSGAPTSDRTAGGSGGAAPVSAGDAAMSSHGVESEPLASRMSAAAGSTEDAPVYADSAARWAEEQRDGADERTDTY